MVDSTGAGSGGAQAQPALADLFHRLNNQLGVILAHAELLESKAPDDQARARASQVVASTLAAMDTTKTIRDRVETPR